MIRRRKSRSFAFIASAWCIGACVELYAQENRSTLHTPIAVLTLTNDKPNISPLKDWREKRFEGQTTYQVVSIDERSAIKATTIGGASALYRNVAINLDTTPLLNWSWRVDNIFPIKNERIKAGDDFAARLYVVVKEGPLPWQTKALNYVWSNNTSLSEQINDKRLSARPHWDNPFTSKAAMIAIQAGEKGLGNWHSHQVNIKEDYYRVFGKRISKIDGIALMTDADNAGHSATSYFGSIFFSAK